MNLIEKLNWRYAAKRMNGRKVSQDNVDIILEAIRLTPTSLGLQAFKVFVIENEELRTKIFENACQQPQIKECSHLLVFAAIKDVNTELVDNYIQKIATTRSMAITDLAGYRAKLDAIVAADWQQNFKWTARQTYIALGVALVAAANLGVDSTPIEGFSDVALDKILGLESQNLSSVSIMTLGYRDEVNDRLASAPKVRKSKAELIENI